MRNDSASSQWFIRFSRADGRRMRLFCLPYAGGGAAIYRQWPQLLPPDIEVWAVQLPGREQRIGEPAMTDAFRLAEMVATAMAPYCDEPYAIFGHSMGAALAYETSLSVMRMNGRPPERLLVSAHRAPHLPSRKEPTYQLPDALFIEELRRLKGTPPAVFEHPELMDLMLPILRSDFQLANSYQAAAPTILPCPVIAFGGEDDPDAELSELRAWREVGTGPFRVHMLKGDHFFINSRHRELTSLVGQELAAVQR